MQDFAFYIQDDRYRVATLRLISLPSVAGARSMALDCLQETPHHLAVEVCENDRTLFRLNRAAVTLSTESSPPL